MLTRIYRSSNLACIGLLVALGLAGCGGSSSDAEFKNAIPDSRSVTINAPTSAGGALTAGQTSPDYVFTYTMTVGVNGTIVGLLAVVETIVGTPATTSTDNTRVWGPGAGDALDPLVYRLTVTKVKTGKFTWSLDARKKTDPDVASSYLSLLSGTADTTSGKNHGSGTMIIPVDTWATLGTDACAAGTLTVTYDTTVEPQSLTVAFNHFRPGCKDGGTTNGATTTANYVYDRAADGSGDFQFSTTGDVQNGTVLPVVLENLVFRSRWLARGEGRSDVVISGGDIAISAPGVTEITGSQCWDASFALTFSAINPDWDSSQMVGVETSCPASLQSALYASAI